MRIILKVKGKPILLLCNKADVDQAQVGLWCHLMIIMANHWKVIKM